MASFNDIELQNALTGLLNNPQNGGLDILGLLQPPQGGSSVPNQQPTAPVGRSPLLSNPNISGLGVLTALQNAMAASNQAPTALPTAAAVAPIASTPITDVLSKLTTTPVPQGGIAPNGTVDSARGDYLRGIDSAVANTAARQAAIPPVDNLNAGARRVNEEAGKADSVYKPSAAAVAQGASTNKIVARRSASGGIEITNVGTGTYEGMSDDKKDSLLGKDFSLANVKSAYDTLTADVQSGKVDAATYATRLANIQSDVMDAKDARENTLLQAQRATLGIDALQSTLSLASAEDAKEKAINPASVPMRAFAVSNQIAKLEQQASNNVATQMKSNLGYNQLENYLTTRPALDGILAKQAGVVSDNAVSDALILHRTPSQVIDNITNVYPQAAQAGPSVMLNTISKLAKPDQELFYAKPADVPVNYLADSTNPVARDILIGQLQKEGKSPEEVTRLVNRGSMIMKDDRALVAAFTPFYKDKKQLQEAIAEAKAPKGDATAKEATRKNTATILKSYMDTEATAAFSANATTWLPKSNPDLNKATDSVLLSQQPATLQNITSAYIEQAPDYPSKVARRKEIFDIIAQQRAATPPTSLGNIKFDELENTLPLAMSGSRLSDISDGVLGIFSKLGGGGLAPLDIATSPIRTALQKVDNNVTGDIVAGFNWLTAPTADNSSFTNELYKIDPTRRND